jgi:hypothetical protein
LEEAAEARAGELDAYQALAGLCVADVHDAALRGEVNLFFLAASSEMGLRDANLEVGTDSHVKVGNKCGATPA